MAILTQFRHRFWNNDGTVASGGKVYVYEAGTSTPKDSYTTSAGDVANTNPVILNSKGEADIWVNGLVKVNLLQSDDVQVTGWPVDNIGSSDSATSANMEWAGTAGGTANALTLSPSTAISAYAIGQSFIFKAGSSNNSGATTVAISGLAAIAVQSNGAACAGAEILANKWYSIVLDSLTTCQIAKIGRGDVVQEIHAATSKSTPVDADEIGIWDSVTGLINKLTWANLKATLGNTFAALAGAAFTGGINEKLSTVASATTPDIFALTVGNVIDYTGTATCTGFVAAPQAGARRTLRCTSAAQFTAGANMLIDGVTSGQTLTCAAGVQVNVLAETTTQFRLTFTPVSGTTTPTVTSGAGTLTTASGTLTYTRIKDRCFFNASCTITTNGTGSSSIVFTLPFTHAATETSSFVGRETAATGNQLWGYISAGAASANIVNLNAGTYPAADGYVLRVSGSFPIA